MAFTSLCGLRRQFEVFPGLRFKVFTGIDALQLATNGLIYADAVQYDCLLPFHVPNVRNMGETLHINKPGCSKINGIG